MKKSRQKIRMTDHDRIREWIEARGGRPASAAPGTGESSLLLIHFPDTNEVAPDQLAWEDFFAQFDRQNLALVCARETQGVDDLSRDFEFVPR